MLEKGSNFKRRAQVGAKFLVKPVTLTLEQPLPEGLKPWKTEPYWSSLWRIVAMGWTHVRIVHAVVFCGRDSSLKQGKDSFP